MPLLLGFRNRLRTRDSSPRLFDAFIALELLGPNPGAAEAFTGFPFLLTASSIYSCDVLPSRSLAADAAAVPPVSKSAPPRALFGAPAPEVTGRGLSFLRSSNGKLFSLSIVGGSIGA